MIILIILTDDPIAMFARCFKALTEQHPELLEYFAIDTSQHFDILCWKFKRCGLESDVSWGVAEDEAKVDVDEVAVSVDQDVAIVSVLDLK